MNRIPSFLVLAVPLTGFACRRAPDPHPLADSSALVALIDAASAPRMSVYGSERPTTPYLERLAEEAVVFEDVSAAAPYTLASVASLFTGLIPDQHRVLVAGDQLPRQNRLLAERFSEAGTRTFAVSTNAHIHPSFGFDRGIDRFEWLDPLVGQTEFHRVPERMFEVLDEELQGEPTRPLFGYLHLMPPHAPYDPPRALRERFDPELVDSNLGSLANLTPLTARARRASESERASILALYDASMLYADGCLERIAAQLEQAGRDEEFLFAVISDHGEAFGEQGLYQHAGGVFETMLRVPWLMRFGDRRLAGTRVDTPVSLIDLLPTLTDLFGLDSETTGMELIGHSVVGLLPGFTSGEQAKPKDRVLFARTAGPGPFSSIRRGNFKAIFASQNKTWSLYDIRSDFYERKNLARAQPEQLEDLQGEYALALARYRPSALRNTRIGLTPELKQQLREIGYLDDDSPGPSIPPGQTASEKDQPNPEDDQHHQTEQDG